MKTFEGLWRVLVNGYPYKTPQEMGLQDEFDAFMATKQAVYRVIDGEAADYFAKDERGNKIVAKIKELVEYHIANGTDAIVATGTTGEASTMTDAASVWTYGPRYWSLSRY